MYLQAIDYKNKYEKNLVIKFLKKCELEFDENVDYTVAIFEDDVIIGTVSKERNIIKCFAIDNNFRSLGLSTKLLTEVMNKLIQEGYSNSMVFTKKCNEDIFKNLGYNEVSSSENVILLEKGHPNFENTFDEIIKKYSIDINKDNGLIIMHANPFTLGHRYLVENALKKCSNILVFVLEENRSFFSFEDRFDLVKKGLEDLKGVKVIPSSRYIISSATFPTYFLKKEDDMLKEYINLDTEIVAKICKKLNVKTRFLGTEPIDNITKMYNEKIISVFNCNNIEVSIVDRLMIGNNIVSASSVRTLLANKDFDSIKDIVPLTTYNFLKEKYGN